MKNNILNHKRKKELTNILFILPATVLFFVIVLEPFIAGTVYSFTDWNGISFDYNFVGFKNYIRAFADTRLIDSARNTIFFTIVTLVCDNLFGLLIAMGLVKISRTTKIMRTMFFIPFVVSLLLSGFIWKYTYQNVYAPLFGVSSPFISTNWVTVMTSICSVGIWRDTGYCMVIFLAALQGIPEVYYEAAEVDGAKPWDKFLHITLPMIVPAFTVTLTLFLGWGLKVFDYIKAATGGGPGRTSYSVAMYVYDLTFPMQKVGRGQAIAVLMTLVIIVLTTWLSARLRKLEVEM